MFAKIEEGVEAYKAELRRYVARVDELKKTYGTIELLAWDVSDYREVTQWNSKLQGMVLALGLTKEEEEAIDRECGVEPAPAAST